MIGPEVTIPDYTDAVVAYRQFHLRRYTQHNFRLVSPHAGTPWMTAEICARCNNELRVPEGIELPFTPKKHSAPHKDCGCGIYAYFVPCPVGTDRAHDFRDPLAGSYLGRYAPEPPIACVQALMSLSGRIEVHARGMRAAKARVCALGLNEGLHADEIHALREIASRFGAALVHESEFPAMASAYGSPLAEDARPKLPETPQPVQPESDLPRWCEPPRPKLSKWRYWPAGLNYALGVGNASLVAIGLLTPWCLLSAGFSFAWGTGLHQLRRRSDRKALAA